MRTVAQLQNRATCTHLQELHGDPCRLDLNSNKTTLAKSKVTCDTNFE